MGFCSTAKFSDTFFFLHILSTMKKAFFILTLLTLVLACKSRKKLLTGVDEVTSEEFVQSFPDFNLPCIFSDTSIGRKLGDSQLISPKIIQNFIPDSVFKHEFSAKAKPKYYLLGKAEDKNGDHYLFIKAATNTRQAIYITLFDKESYFKSSLLLLTNNTDEKQVHYEGGMDRKFNIIKNKQIIGKDGQFYYNKLVYVYNTAGTFTLILTESNEELEEKEVYNPIFDKPATQKNTGDFIKDRKNFVTVRDGSRNGKLVFFIHFEKNGGDCIGEIKGEATLIKPNLARYSASGDPCALDITFETNRLTIKETQGCGNYRGIKCFFDGSFPKKISKRSNKTVKVKR